MPPSSLSSDLQTLRATLSALRALLTTFRSTITSSTASPPPPPHSPNPLSLLSDASKLLKAQTTKLSLLILNKPFSAREVTFILNALTKSVLPALMSGLDLCAAEVWTMVVHQEVRRSLGVLWTEVGKLVDCIPEDGGDGGQEKHGEKALASTGVLWEECDKLIGLGEKGLVWLVDGKVKGYLELLEDAIAEVADWDPDGDSEDDDLGEDEDEEDGGGSTGKDVVNTPTTSEDEGLGEGMTNMTLSPIASLKVRVLKHLRLIKLLYPALRKWRVGTFQGVTDQKEAHDRRGEVARFDQLVEHTQHFTEHADELAGILYDGAGPAVQKRLIELSDEAMNCLELARLDWTGAEDGFTHWCIKWRDRFQEVNEKG